MCPRQTLRLTWDVGPSIVSRLQDRMGKVDVILEAVEEIPRSANGKFRAVICNLPQLRGSGYDCLISFEECSRRSVVISIRARRSTLELPVNSLA